ncbi:MAG: glycosyltransferase [Methanobrevibacter thaueri]|nr:glycosyltransferase [Methanobrevibacter thaueri]
MLVENNRKLEDELLQEKIKVSVVIPVYNVEEFLGECLDSIVNQTLKDIEIICVNDGSKDKSLEILNYYAANDDRFIVIDQENGGHAVATNRGMELARGKYLYLMDSDDFVELNTLEEAYNYAEEKDVDFVIFQSMNYVTDEDRYYKAENYSMEKVADFVGDSVFNYRDLGDLIFNITVTPWSKLYRTNFVRDCGATFPEGLIFDDNIFFWDVLFSAKKIAFLRKHLFNRRWYSYSSTTAGDQRFLDSIDINNLMIDRFKKYGAFEQHKKTLYNRKVNMTYNRFVDIKPEFEQMFFEKLHDDYKKVVNDGYYEDYLSVLDNRNKSIFEYCLNSETYIEFKYQMAFWDASQTRKKKDKVIGELQRENKAIKNDVSTLKNEKNNLKNERDSLKNEVTKLKKDIINENNLKNQIKTLKDENIHLKNENIALENKNNKLGKEISQFKSSNSWKITKPLRKIKKNL